MAKWRCSVRISTCSEWIAALVVLHCRCVTLSSRESAPSLDFFQNFSSEALQELIFELVRLDRSWIPQQEGHSLYIRPTLSKCYLYNWYKVLITLSQSWNTTRHWGRSTRWGPSLRHTKSCRSLLSAWLQARLIIWNDWVYQSCTQRSAWNHVCWRRSDWLACRYWRL